MLKGTQPFMHHNKNSSMLVQAPKISPTLAVVTSPYKCNISMTQSGL